MKQQKCNEKSFNDWENATNNDINNYKSIQNQKMSNFVMPEDVINCSNFLCSDHNNIIWQKQMNC